MCEQRSRFSEGMSSTKFWEKIVPGGRKSKMQRN